MSLVDLMADPFFVEAPTYQRSFVWTKKEAGQLLKDVASAQETAANGGASVVYCFASMLFVERQPSASRPRSWPRSRSRANRLLDVVDGLQRLTTLTILFCVLRDLDARAGGTTDPRLLAAIRVGQGADARNRLSLGEREDRFLNNHVRNPGATLASPESGALSQAEKRIVEVRDHFVSELASQDAEERRLLAIFLLEQCYVVQVVTADVDLAYGIFTVFNARGKPLARNEILKALLLESVPSASEPVCTSLWKAAEGRLGEHFEQFFSHVRGMYRRPDGRVIADIKAIAAEKGGAQVFIERVLQPAADILDDILAARHSGHPQSASIAQHLRYLSWHSFSDWIPPAMLWWLEKGDDAEGLAQFLRRLDRLAFGTRLLAIGGSKRKGRFSAVAMAIRNGRGLDSADSPLELSRQELRTIQHNLRALHERNAQAAKHLLLRLSDFKAGAPQSEAMPADMTVEHVLPRKLSTTSQWRVWHPDPGDREQCTESLGNLVLVTKAQNDRAGNLDFARKLEIYFSTPDAPIVAINQDLRDRTEWKAADIKARETALMQLIQKLWDFDLTPSRERIKEPA